MSTISLRLLAAACLTATVVVWFPTSARASSLFSQTNLTSDISGMAANTDTNLKNPWGISFGATTPFWVSDQGTGVATLYTGTGSSVPLVVTVPPTSPPPAGPTGQVFNGTTSFALPSGGASHFIFDTLAGTIDAWGGGTTASVMATRAGAVYTGLAIGSVGSNNFLYAANNVGGIDVYDGNFNNVSGTTFAGKFVDPNPVAGFTPYNIQNLGGNLFVTYAAVTMMGVPLPGGYVDKFDSSGNFLARIATGGPINTPWGLTLAPAGFGTFGGDLLVGNLYDSKINAFNLANSNHLDGSIAVNTGFASPVGLWGLDFGNGANGFDTGTLYFTAGVNDQRDGLFGSIQPVPEPGAAGITAIGLMLVFGAYRRIRRPNSEAR